MTKNRADLAALALIALAMLRMISTFTVLSATYDESTHVSAGLELLDQHQYWLQPENPPLAPLIFAIAPALAGMKYEARTPKWLQVRELFFQNGRYKTNLFVSRIGPLLFFLIASLATWWWARRELGPSGGLLAMLLFTTQPIVIGYSAVVTHDGAGVAGMAVTVLAFVLWLERPSLKSAAILGAAWGFAILCKLSSLGYVPLACAAILAVRLLREAGTRRLWRAYLQTSLAALPACAFVVWAAYAFTIGHVRDLLPHRPTLEKSAIGRFAISYPDLPLPAPRLFFGILGLQRFNEHWTSYLFGETRQDGWWYYFPVAIGLKTTIASLLLAIGALRISRFRVALESIAAALAMICAAMPSHLDIGVRYILPAYVFLAVAGASVVLVMLDSPRRVLRLTAIALLTWHCAAGVVAHPDYFPYFNELTIGDPSRYLIDSNLDWGQDVLRLREVLRRRHVDRVGLDLLAINNYDELGFPPSYEVQFDKPATGWIAVSETKARIFRGYEWLEGKPFERVGKSIRLYHL